MAADFVGPRCLRTQPEPKVWSTTCSARHPPQGENMATTSNTTQPDDVPAPVPEPPSIPDRAGWVVPVTVIGVVVALMACAFGAFLVHAYPVLKEPLTVALSIATLAGLIVTTVVSLNRRR
ncbi:hypothetical protein ACIPPM_24295 [Streptomyces sp. NPDC090119]|uniref:hypothetical protein n=2 Tax=Streptomyces TaxID=1883 RepID=UPI0033A46C3D